MTSDFVKKLTEEIKEALKARSPIRVSTLRLLSNAIHNEEIDKQRELSSQESFSVVQSEAKRRQEAIEALRQAQGKLTGKESDINERIAKEKEELGILQEFLPKQMTGQEIEND